MQSFDIPNAYLFLKRMNRLLFHREKRNEVEGADGTTTTTKFGYYGVLDLVTRDEVVLLQRMDRHIHSSSIMMAV